MEIVDIVSAATVVTSILVYAAGSKTALVIFKNKTTGSVTLFPYVACLYSAVIWLKYGLLANVSQLIYTQSISLICQLFSIIIFYGYSRDRRSNNRLLMTSLPLLLLVLVKMKYYTDSAEEAIKQLGLLGTFVMSGMYASPLISLGEVLRTKNCKSIDFGFVSMACLCTACWLLLGLMIGDVFILLPNAFGFIATIFQLSLFMIYPSTDENTELTNEGV